MPWQNNFIFNTFSFVTHLCILLPPLGIYFEWINIAYKKEIDLDVKEIILLVIRVIIYDQYSLEISEENYTNQDGGHTSGWADLIKWNRMIKR